MSDTTNRYALPLLAAGQAQKELFHNEALVLVDALLHSSVEAVAVDTPPATPSYGQCWIVGTNPNGAFTDHAKALAAWTEGGWRFAMPHPGMEVWSLSDAVFARFDGTEWVVGALSVRSLTIGGQQIVGAQQPAISDPTGGTMVDSEARAAISAILTALRTHGLIAS